MSKIYEICEIDCKLNVVGTANTVKEAYALIRESNTESGWALKSRREMGGVVVWEYRSDHNHLSVIGFGPDDKMTRRAVGKTFGQLS